ncbi:hypothetical protein GCK32_015629 [Trichostrongylus colubriformis]|uniref:Uncharacterized protein n=1 Tax=Trichostrongylus colubriformis TaxID=6319 RepID=A0AAN8IJU1_TRICO
MDLRTSSERMHGVLASFMDVGRQICANTETAHRLIHKKIRARSPAHTESEARLAYYDTTIALKKMISDYGEPQDCGIVCESMQNAKGWQLHFMKQSLRLQLKYT